MNNFRTFTLTWRSADRRAGMAQPRRPAAPEVRQSPDGAADPVAPLPTPLAGLGCARTSRSPAAPAQARWPGPCPGSPPARRPRRCATLGLIPRPRKPDL